MKFYTDIEQSKKLAKVLPHKSADMNYIPYAGENGKEYEVNLCKYLFTNWVAIPCWSIAALLDFLSADFYIEIKHLDTQWELDCRTQVTYAIELVDACVELIYKLKEIDLL